MDHTGSAVDWYAPFLAHVVEPHLVLIVVVVVLAQLFAGARLLTGRFVTAGLAIGMVLNLSFLAAGAVNPSAFYLLSPGCVALWMVERQALTQRTQRQLTIASLIAGAVALASIPSIRTLVRSQVIDDPGIMLVTGGVLTVFASELVRARAETRAELTAPAGAEPSPHGGSRRTRTALSAGSQPRSS